MTRRDDLVRLRDAVQAGDIGVTGPGSFTAIPKRGGGVYSDPNWYDAGSAYWQGSLDAAKALHEALLPDWTRAVDATMPEAGIEVKLYPAGDPLADAYAGPSIGDDLVEARAWLIAICNALIAQEDAQDRGTEG